MAKSDFKFVWHRAIVCSQLPDKTKLVGVALWNYTNAAGGNAHPGYALLANDLGCSISTVKRQLRDLREIGWIRKTRQSNSTGSRAFADVYELSIPAYDRGSQLWTSINKDRGSELWPSIEEADQTDRGSNQPDRGSNQPDRGSELWPTNKSSTTSSFQHSDSDESGRKQASAMTLIRYDNEEAFEATLDYIEEKLGGFMGTEESTVRGMLAAGSHHKAIINKIESDRPF